MNEQGSDDNPFVGPRPYSRSEAHRDLFFGRSAEIDEVISYVYSQPITLIYSPSGAGKSSLMNAGVIPVLEEKHGFQVLPVARIRGGSDLENADSVACFYTYQLIRSVAPQLSLESVRNWTIADFLASQDRPAPEGDIVPRILVIDQFEEILILYSGHSLDQQRMFFRQMSEALKTDPLLRIVLLVREDRVTQLEPFSALLPDGLGLRYRLDHLTSDNAREAILRIAHDSAKPFSVGAAEALVGQLSRTRAEVHPGQFELIRGTRVEPVQLQVVCSTIWEKAAEGVIQSQDLPNLSDVRQALAQYYSETVHDVATRELFDEGTLREWFSLRLITPVKTRGTVFQGPTHTDDVIPVPNTVVDRLEQRHLIRGERRMDGGGRWMELVHDSFVDSILEANSSWAGSSEPRYRAFTRLLAPPIAVAFAALIASSYLYSPTALTTPLQLTGETKSDEPSSHKIALRGDELLGVAARATVGEVAQLSLQPSHGADLVDLDPGPGFRAITSGLPRGEYELRIEGLGDDPAIYQTWLAEGRELTIGEPVEGSLSSSGVDYYLVKGSGNLLTFDLRSRSFDTVLSVESLDQSYRDSNDDGPNMGSDSQLDVFTDRNQIYLISVSAFFSGEGGLYELEAAERVAPRPLVVGARRAGTLDRLEGIRFRLANDVSEFSLTSSNRGYLLLSISSAAGTFLMEEVSPNDLAGVRVTVPDGMNRVATITNLGEFRADYVVEARTSADAG